MVDKVFDAVETFHAHFRPQESRLQGGGVERMGQERMKQGWKNGTTFVL